MKINYIEINLDKKIYDYECTKCGKHYPTFPVYYPGNRVCKFCPECGHEFVKPEDENASN